MIVSHVNSFRHRAHTAMSESNKVLTIVLTDAQRRGDVPLLHHDSVRVGIVTYHWVYAEYLSLAVPSVGQAVRHYLEITRWSGVEGCQPRPDDLRRFYLAPFRHRSVEQHQHIVPRVIRSHLDANNFHLHRYCLHDSEKIQAKPHEEQKGNSIEVVDLTNDTDDEVIDLTDD